MNMTTTTEAVFESIAKAEALSPTTLNGLPGLSSLEIAEATGKDHKNVLRGIKKMLREVGSLLSQRQYVETSYRDSQGKTQPLIVLDKELTFTVLTGYNASLRLLVNRRWLELEGSGFTRVSVQASVAHLVESDKESRSVALKSLSKSKRNRPLTPTQKETQRFIRAASGYARKEALQGR
ncbi:Rha family transcriptional regulator [Pseudomonas oryzihabitans]|uniref:Rha family transcriptional regulator n=1 Tax=Pseudomonas oryzihabitans TaxID=47885 RepID=UPI0011AA9AF5|nr:Rha family transcriptional regulator [Pseudomonas oryzihabitans]